MSDSVMHTRANCRLCESSALELALPMRDSAIGDAYITEEELCIKQDLYPLSLYLCKQCSHLQLPQVINPKILFGNYIYSTSTSPGLVEHFKAYADTIVSSSECKKNSLVVEIGSNDGSLLKAFKQHDLRVLGIDPAREIAAKATQNGLETINNFFSCQLAKEIKEKYGSASIIAANNVFAHVDNMIDVVEGIRYLLDPEGVFVFEVSYLVDMIQKNVFDTIYHEHLCHHRIEPLNQFFNRHGMTLFDVQKVSTKGGSIRGFAKLISSKREILPIVEDMIQHERELALDKIETYKQFSNHLEVIKANLSDVLEKFREQGKSIVGYGASTPVTTTVYQFELGSYLNYFVDDNPIKQGRYSPGHHLPIYPSNSIYEKMPDCIVILAWQYAQSIMQKHQQYLDEGGCFIVPLPNVQVYDNQKCLVS